MSGEFQGFFNPINAQFPDQRAEAPSQERFDVIAYLKEQDGEYGMAAPEYSPAIDVPEPPVEPYSIPAYRGARLVSRARAQSWTHHQPSIKVDSSALLETTPLEMLAPVTETPIYERLTADQTSTQPIVKVISLQERGPLVDDRGSIFEHLNAQFQAQRGQGYNKMRRPAIVPPPKFESLAPAPLVRAHPPHTAARVLPLNMAPFAETPVAAIEEPVKALPRHNAPAPEQEPALPKIGEPIIAQENRISLRGIRASVAEYAGRHDRVMRAAEYAGTVAAAAIVGAKLFGRLRRR